MRIRTIKPEFFLHEELFDLEEETGLPIRVAFAGLWCAADREGRFLWKIRRLKSQILPYDDVDFAALMSALLGKGFVERYGPDGEYGLIPSFKTHQHINQREAQSTIPGPADEDARARTCTHVQDITTPNGVNLTAKIRQKVYDRDGRKCVRCGATEDLTVDHIFPRSIGGTHALANLRTLCRSCNSARPVAGEALIEDLLKDGYTLEHMKSTCMHVHARVEGKGREQGKESVSKGKSTRKKFKAPTLAEWTDYGQTLDPPFEPTAAASAWNHYEAVGWKVGRNPMKDWKAACRTCHGRWVEQSPPRRTKVNGAAPAAQAQSKPPSTWEIKTKLEAVEDRIKELKSRSPGEHCSLRDFLSDSEWSEYQDLHRSRDSLRKSLTKIA